MATNRVSRMNGAGSICIQKMIGSTTPPYIPGQQADLMRQATMGDQCTCFCDGCGENLPEDWVETCDHCDLKCCDACKTTCKNELGRPVHSVCFACTVKCDFHDAEGKTCDQCVIKCESCGATCCKQCQEGCNACDTTICFFCYENGCKVCEQISRESELV